MRPKKRRGSIDFAARISGIGVARRTPERVATRIRATNLVAVGLAIGSCLFIPAMWFAGERTLSIAVIFPILAYFGCLVLNAYGQFKLARLLLVGILDSGIFFYAAAFGRGSGLHFLLFPGSALSCLIFDLKEKRGIFWSVFLPMCLLAMLFLSDFNIPGVPVAHMTAPHVVFWTVATMSFCVMLGSLLALYVSYERTIEELRAGQRKLIYSSKMSALGEMSSGIAHEINNYLTSLQARAAQVRMLAEAGKLDTETSIRISSQMTESVMRIHRIIRALKSISRDSNQDRHEQVQISRLIQDALVLSRERTRECGIVVKQPTVSDALVIECCSVQITQVLLNLLNNAHDAVESLDDKWIQLDCNEEEGGVLLRVTDSGAGIPKEILKQLFLPFFTTKMRGRGTGLGLSISKEIVERHGGWLKPDSTHANTSFLVYLPKVKNQKAPGCAASASTRGSQVIA